MKRREFSVMMAILPLLGILSGKSKVRVKRVLKIKELKDINNIAGTFKDKIKSDYDEINFIELRKGYVFFLEAEIQNSGMPMKFDGPFIAKSDMFPGGGLHGLGGIKVERAGLTELQYANLS